MRILLIWMVFALFPIGSSAQGLKLPAVPSEQGVRSDFGPGTLTPTLSSSAIRGLLDPSRLSMSHTYSMMFSSDGTSGALTGLYLNTLRYRFDAPLLMEVQVGYLHGGGGLLGGRMEAGAGHFVVPGVKVQYRPSKRFTVTFQYGYASNNRYDLARHYRLREFEYDLFGTE